MELAAVIGDERSWWASDEGVEEHAEGECEQALCDPLDESRSVFSRGVDADDFRAPARSKRHERNHLSHVHFARRLCCRPDQSLEHPLGRRGRELHHWHIDEPLNDADARARDLLLRPRGAYVMGRNMFGPIRCPWEGDWRGWWGDEPPITLRFRPHALRARADPARRAGRRSLSSRTASMPRSRMPRKPQVIEAWTSQAARRPCARRSRQP